MRRNEGCARTASALLAVASNGMLPGLIVLAPSASFSFNRDHYPPGVHSPTCRARAAARSHRSGVHERADAHTQRGSSSTLHTAHSPTSDASSPISRVFTPVGRFICKCVCVCVCLWVFDAARSCVETRLDAISRLIPPPRGRLTNVRVCMHVSLCSVYRYKLIASASLRGSTRLRVEEATEDARSRPVFPLGLHRGAIKRE